MTGEGFHRHRVVADLCLDGRVEVCEGRRYVCTGILCAEEQRFGLSKVVGELG